MSRIGKKPVFLPKGVTATINNGVVTMQGPKGELSLTLHPHAMLTTSEEEGVSRLDVTVQDPERADRAVWGTMRALLAQMATGVSEGYSKALELNGVGFKMNLQGTTLTFSLGFSHDVTFPLPTGIAAKIEQNILTISGADAALVGKVAAEIRSMKKPEPYKGKGFRYTDEVIRRKAGKASKSE
ncbi:MAG: 50S ribosomal protein L6 [Patescibacteria group bacterium]